MISNLVNLTTRQARAESWADYQREASRRLDVLDGFWLEHLKNWSRSRLTSDGWEQIYRDLWPWTTETNMTRRVINRISRVYAGPVRRARLLDAPDGESEDPGYQALLESDHSVNRVCDFAMRYAIACGICLVRPILREDDNTWAFHLITPDLFTPEVDRVDPSRLVKVTYIVPQADSPTGQTIYDRYTFSIKDASSPYFEVQDENGRLISRIGNNPDARDGEATDGPYPYIEDGRAFLPFAIFRTGNSPMELVNRAEGSDLYDLSLKAGLTETVKTWKLLQGGKFLVLSGDAGVKDDKVLDVSTPIVFNAGEFTANILDRIDDCARYDDALELWERRAIESRTGTPIDKIGAGVESAKSLQIRDKGLNAVILGLQGDAFDGEKDLARIMSSEWNLFGPGEPVNMESRFTIDFPDWQESDPIETYDIYKQMIDDRITNRAAFLMRINKDIRSEAEAADIIRHNERIERQLSGISSEARDAAATIPQSEPGDEGLPDERTEIEQRTEEAGQTAQSEIRQQAAGLTGGAEPS